MPTVTPESPTEKLHLTGAVLNDPQAPARKFLEAASQDPAPIDTTYSPPDSVKRLAEVIFTSKAESFIELAQEAGVNRTTIWRLLQDRNAVKWIVQQGTAVAAAGLGAVHARLLHLALTSRSPGAIEIYLKRFDPEYAKDSKIGAGTSINNQFNQLITMSPKELEAFVRHKKRSGGFIDDRAEGPGPH